jgi:hypothetical protein
MTEIEKPHIMAIVFTGVVMVIMIGYLFISGFLAAGSENSIETFPVSNPLVDQNCSLNYYPSGAMSVLYYNGSAWNALTAANYTVSGKTVWVNSSALV